MLSRIQNPSLRVLVLWEPILPTDLAPPVSSVLARISDRRAIQYWDKTHQIAERLRNAGAKPDCCEQDGVLWDIAAVFGRQTRWSDSPRAEFVDGPVVKVHRELEAAVARLLGQ